MTSLVSQNLEAGKRQKKQALEDAKKIAADMKNQDVKDAVARGEIPEIVALIAYMNSLK